MATGNTASPNDHDHEHTKSLYDVLGLTKGATEDDIKRAYRKLALRYHPDKNRDGDPEKTEMFKEINHANAILSDPKKRKIYDEYGDMGLKMLDQFGDGFVGVVMKPWLKWVVLGIAVLTCGCFGCCCCCFCCCNFCCGKFKPKVPEEGEYMFAEDETITSQPGASGNGTNVVIHMPEPAQKKEEEANKVQETTSPSTPIPLGPPPAYGSTQNV